MPRRFTSLDIVLVLIPVALVLQVPRDPDLWWHLRVGKDILSGAFSFVDTYTWSMPAYPWVDHEWLTNVAMYAVYSLSGLTGLGVCFAAIIGMAMLVTVRTGAVIVQHVRSDARFTSAAGWRLGGILVIMSLLIANALLGTRPQMITLLGFGLVNYLLWQFITGELRSLWLLPLLFLIWSNLHGGFVVGLAQTGLALVLFMLARALPRLRTAYPFSLLRAEDYWLKIRHLVLVGLVSFLATLVNPYTYHVYEEAWRTSLDQYARARITEWLAINFQSSTGLLIGIMLVIFICGLLWSRQFHSAWHLLLFPVYLYLGLGTIRHVALLVLFLLPWIYMALAAQPAVGLFLGDLVDRLFAIRFRNGWYVLYSAILVIVPLAVVIVSIVVFVSNSQNQRLLAQRMNYPLGAVEYLREHARPDERLFNDYNWGGFLIWNLPEQPVYIDGRMASWQTSSKHILAEYDAITGLAPDWLDLLKSNHITYVLMPSDSKLASVLRLTAWFHPVYEDLISTVFKSS